MAIKPSMEELSSGTTIETRWISDREKIIRTSHREGHTTYQKRFDELLHSDKGPAYVNLSSQGPLCYFWENGVAAEGQQSAEAAKLLIAEFDGLPSA